MNVYRPMIILVAWCHSIVLPAQTVTLQFMQTEYDIKGLYMIDELTGLAVGASHWDQVLKTYRSTILKTVDGGVTWNRQNVSFSDDLWAIHFTDADHGWAAGNSGLLLYSEDGGTTWNKKSIGTVLDFKSICFSDQSNGWVVANEEVHYLFDEPDAWRARIWHTSNGGESWVEQELPPDAGLIHRLYFKNNTEGWALGVKNENIDVFADTYCAAYYTDDGGETWIEKYSPGLALVFTDMVFPDEDHGYMVGFASNSGETGGNVFRTSDGGESWERLEVTNVLWQVDFIDSLRGYAVGADYIAAWGPPVFRTMDGGETWDKIRMEENYALGIYGLALFEDRVIALGDDGYQVKSTDPWGDYGEWYGEHLFSQMLIDTMYQFEDVFFISPLLGWAVGRKSTRPYKWEQVIMHSDDGGEHWREQYSFQSDFWAVALRLNAVQFVNETTGWAVGYVVDAGATQTSGILHTDDGGETWTQQGQGISEGQIVDLFFLDEQNGWALTDVFTYPGNYVQLLKTTDGGENWEMVSTNQQAYITVGFGVKSGSLLFQDENTGWILGVMQELLRTTDGGETWTSLPRPELWTNTYDIGFSSELCGTICGRTIFNTGDGGESWTENFSSDKILTDLCFLDSMNGLMVGEWGNIYHTPDGGLSWNRVEHQATQAALISVSFPDGKNGWAAGRAGTIVHIDPSTVSSVSVNSASISSPALFQNHPNPFSNQTEIRFMMAAPGHALLSVYDMNGRKIITLAEGYRSEGIHTILWDGSDVEHQPVRPGLYIYKLVTEKGSTSRSMVIL